MDKKLVMQYGKVSKEPESVKNFPVGLNYGPKSVKLIQIVKYYGDPGDSRLGYLTPDFPDYWCAPGAWPHLQVPGVTRGRGSVFKAHTAGHPLK